MRRPAMLRKRLSFAAIVVLAAQASLPYVHAADPAGDEFPRELVSFVPYPGNPVFAGTGQDTWDRKIRERGYILREDGVYHLWYTGYRGDYAGEKPLGY